MNRNKKFKVYAASGYYDLDTPYFGTVYSLHHLGIDPSVRDNLKLGFFEAGPHALSGCAVAGEVGR